MRIYMQTRPINEDGTSGTPRFFQLILQEELMGGWNMVKESGQQGYSGKVSKQQFETWEQAQEAMLTLRDKQALRGYHVVFMQGQAPPKA
jgi:predicted DNA-binding WGR domain protein